MKDEKSKWVKYGAVFTVIIMVGAIFGLMLGAAGEIFRGDGGWRDSLFGTGNRPVVLSFDDVPGTHVDFTFRNAIDAVQHIPDGVLAVHIWTVNDAATAQEIQSTFPGSNASKIMRATYPTGMLEYIALESSDNVSIALGRNRPHFEYYLGYSLLVISPNQRVVVGNPPLIVSMFNPAVDNSLPLRAIDVLFGRTAGSTNLNEILAFADDVENFNSITVFRALDGSDYEMFYQRFSTELNMTTLRASFHLETIILRPTPEMRQEVFALAENAGEGVEFTVTEIGDALRIYIESSNATNFIRDRDALYSLVESHTNQSS